MTVDLLLEHPQLIANAEKFVEQNFKWNLFGLERRIGWVEHKFASMPACPQLFNDRIRVLVSHSLKHRFNRRPQKLLQGHFQSRYQRAGFGGSHPAPFGVNGAESVIKADFGSVFGNASHHSHAVLLMFDLLADVQRCNFHRGVLTINGHESTRIYLIRVMDLFPELSAHPDLAQINGLET